MTLRHKMADNLEGYDYQFVDPGPTDDQKCPICHLVVRDAHQVTCCGSLLCKCCLTKCTNGLGNCPMCRENIKNATMCIFKTKGAIVG